MKKYKMNVIIILGPPGSGKGTQAELLRKKFNLEYIGSGDLLRKRAKKNDYTGRKLKNSMIKGLRTPTPIIFNIWMNKLEKFKKTPRLKGLIFDGSPRTATEAQMLEQALEWYSWQKNKKTIFIDISPKEIINRLTKRRICIRCGRIVPYIGQFKKLKKCDRCGGFLKKRSDDNLRGVKERLRWFRTEVKPVIDYYRKKGNLIRINGEQPIEDVSNDILKAIKK